MAIDKDNPYRKELVALLHSIDEETPLSEGNRIMILHVLNSEEKIKKFVEWVKSNLKEGKLKATEAEIARAAVQASKE